MPDPSGTIVSAVSTLVSLVVGAAATFFASRYYYIKSGKDLRVAAQDLKRETQSLKSLTVNMARGLEEKGLAEFARDRDGNITGIVLHLGGTVSVKFSASGEPTVTPKKQ